MGSITHYGWDFECCEQKFALRSRLIPVSSTMPKREVYTTHKLHIKINGEDFWAKTMGLVILDIHKYSTPVTSSIACTSHADLNQTELGLHCVTNYYTKHYPLSILPFLFLSRNIATLIDR